ncbi:hypothetical protein [Candidatus Erwinia dacicola]|uniref:Fimbrial family protein n=1 Tax=Candidatus Erwinia dacicola TaxID=252393 RepID=A0A328TSI6_9GAMM|nr:hypothetical protein [Candidatus Erwinia dacicola]NJC99355.1 hypothetical protein [Candidatus Erwinia dacicola]NJD84844.1 hypothetical protein [Candidatus Erwinia dacicola]RAP72542.1 fimbrial family protein [Candidatus Erwinia dacicola]
MNVNIITRILTLNSLISLALSIMTFATYGSGITLKNKQFALLKNSAIYQPGTVMSASISFMSLCLIAGFSMENSHIYYPSWASPLTTIDGYTGFLTPEGLLIVLSGGSLRVTVMNTKNNRVSTGLNFGSQGKMTLSGPGVKNDNACWTIDMVRNNNTSGSSLDGNINVSIYVPENVLPGTYTLPPLWVGRYGMTYMQDRTIVDRNDIITVLDTSPKCTVNIPVTINFGTITPQSSSGVLLGRKDGSINYQCTGYNPVVDITMRATSTSQKENNNTLYLVRNGASTILARLQGVIDSVGSSECDASVKRISFDGRPISLGRVANNSSGQLPISWLLCTPAGGINDFGSGKATATLEFDWK